MQKAKQQRETLALQTSAKGPSTRAKSALAQDALPRPGGVADKRTAPEGARVSLARYDDWPARLLAFLADSQRQRFAWGRNDCCLFVCDAVLAMTGTDLAAAVRGRYGRASEALRLCAAEGGLEAVVERTAGAHGLAPISPAFAGRGDMVLLEQPALGATLTLVDFDGQSVLGPGENGITKWPLALCKRAWRV
jgi:hypothetical protein